MNNEQRIAGSAWLLFLTVLCVSLAQQGMWLDELQVWGLAQESNGIGGLFHAIRNEGHPPLWPLLVKAATLVSDHPLAMAVLHGLFAAATTWLVLFRAPWPLHWRIATVFGYFFLFEYAVIARNYGPALFFLVLALHARSQRRPWIVLFALIAMALTHLWGIVLAGAWAVPMIIARDADRAERVRMAVVLMVCIASLSIAWPAADLPYEPRVERITMATLPQVIGDLLGRVFLPFPDLAQERPWNTGWMMVHLPAVHPILGWILFGITLWCVRSDRRLLLFYGIAVAGILAFPLLAPFQSLRYIGPVLLAFLAALWRMPVGPDRWRKRAVLILLLLQVPAGIAMTVVSLRMPRSMASASVHWLEHSAHAGLPVVVHPHQAVPALGAYLGRPVYSLATGSFARTCDWTYSPFRLPGDEWVRALKASPFDTAVLITDAAGLAEATDPSFTLTALPSFAPAMIRSEEHHLYLFRRSVGNRSCPGRESRRCNVLYHQRNRSALCPCSPAPPPKTFSSCARPCCAPSPTSTSSAIP